MAGIQLSSYARRNGSGVDGSGDARIALAAPTPAALDYLGGSCSLS